MKLSALDAAKRLPVGGGRILLHGARNDDGLAERSMVACWPRQTFQITDDLWEIRACDGALVDSGRSGHLRALGAFVDAAVGASSNADVKDGETHATIGDGVPAVLGFLGYEAGQFIERLATRHRPLDGVPHVWLGVYDALYVVDERLGAGTVVASSEAAGAALRNALSSEPVAQNPPTVGALHDDWSREEYESRVSRILEYVAAGDVYQVNLARRLVASIVTAGDPLAIYEAIAAQSPAPLGAFVEAGGTAIVSGSPELFLRKRAQDSRLETRPIKGTRRRLGPHDEELAQELICDPKERAEHLMIVDLERNDLGRVAKSGTVKVDRFGYVVALPTLYHMVSTISCELRPEVSTEDILRATFPGGSITGAPKVRAMQIIDELESAPRGPYTGAIGAFGPGGAMTLSIAIRTATVNGDSLALHVGGGIVADSSPAREYEETEEKAAAWRRALESLAPA